MATNQLKARALDAAAKYLQRTGMQNIRLEGSDALYALDNDRPVLVIVSTGKGTVLDDKGIKNLRRRKIVKESLGTKRIDKIEIMVISEDRALLRHHQDVIEK